MTISEKELDALADKLAPLIMERLMADRPWRRTTFLPSPEVFQTDPSEPFMAHSTCTSRDFLHPEYARICALLEEPIVFHRKQWEWVFIAHHAFRACRLGVGKRCLGFGVGTEKLPAVFAEAGAFVTATDAPSEIGIKSGWTIGNQFAQGTQSLPTLKRLSREAFEQRVEFRICDMNHIEPSLASYDFCWSACAFEHLGDLEKGLEFVRKSVETLKVGGLAVHTTELNLSSNTRTLESGPTVLYRRRDIEAVSAELRSLGHKVSDLHIALDSFAPDDYVDVPPYLHVPHLKLEVGGFVTTSVGLVIERGR
jgi:hypothetical protein